MREIFIQLVHTSGSRFYGLLLGIVSLTLTARWLGPEGRGIAAAVATWVTAFSTFGHFSLGQVAVKNASNSNNNQWLKESFPILLICIGLAFLIALTLVAGLAIFGYNIFIPLPFYYVLLIFSAFPFYIFEIYSSSLLISLDYLKKYNALVVMARTAALIVLPILILFFKMGPSGLVISNLVAQIIICFGSYRIISKHLGKLELPTKKVLSSYFKDGAFLHVNTIGTFLFTGGDILILNYVRGSTETGLYQLSSQLISVLLIIPQSASLIFYSQVSRLGPKLAWVHQKKLIMLLTGLMLFASIAANLSVDVWLPIVAGNDFKNSINVFKWQLITMVAMSFCTMLSAQWISRGFFWQISLIALIIGSLNLLANKFLIPRYGMIGAAWAGLASFIVAFIINCIFYFYISRKDSENLC